MMNTNLPVSAYHFLLDEYVSSEFGNSQETVQSDVNEVLTGIDTPHSHALRRMLDDMQGWRASLLERTNIRDMLQLWTSDVMQNPEHVLRSGMTRMYDTLDAHLVKVGAAPIARDMSILHAAAGLTRDDFALRLCRLFARVLLAMAHARQHSHVIWLSGTQGHAVAMAIDLTRHELTICNSGQGIDAYHMKQQAGDTTLYQLIVTLDNMHTEKCINVMAHTLMVGLIAFDILTASAYTTDVNSLYAHLPKNNNGKLVSRTPDAFFYRPQMSGSCTFYSIYWLMRWFFGSENVFWHARHVMFDTYAAHVRRHLANVDTRNKPDTDTLLHAIHTKGSALLAHCLRDKKDAERLAYEYGWNISNERRDWTQLMDMLETLRQNHAPGDAVAATRCPQLPRALTIRKTMTKFFSAPPAMPTSADVATVTLSLSERLEEVLARGNVYDFVDLVNAYQKDSDKEYNVPFKTQWVEQWYWRAYDAPDAFFRDPALSAARFRYFTIHFDVLNSVRVLKESSMSCLLRWVVWFRAAELQLGWFYNNKQSSSLEPDSAADLVLLRNFCRVARQSYFGAHVDLPRLLTRLARYAPFIPPLSSTYQTHWLRAFPLTHEQRTVRPRDRHTIDTSLKAMFTTLLIETKDDLQQWDDDTRAFFAHVSNHPFSGHNIHVTMDPYEVLCTLQVLNAKYAYEEELPRSHSHSHRRFHHMTCVLGDYVVKQNYAPNLIAWATLVARHDLVALTALVSTRTFTESLDRNLVSQRIRWPAAFDQADSKLVEKKTSIFYEGIVHDTPGDSKLAATSFYNTQRATLQRQLPGMLRILQYAALAEHAHVILACMTLYTHYRVDLSDTHVTQSWCQLISKWVGAHDLLSWFVSGHVPRNPMEAAFYVFAVCMRLIRVDQVANHNAFVKAYKMMNDLSPTLELHGRSTFFPQSIDEVTQRLYNATIRWCTRQGVSRHHVTVQVIKPYTAAHKLPLPLAYAILLQVASSSPDTARPPDPIYLVDLHERLLENQYLFTWSHGTSEACELSVLPDDAERAPCVLRMKQIKFDTTLSEERAVEFLRHVYDHVTHRTCTMILYIDVESMQEDILVHLPDMFHRRPIWIPYGDSHQDDDRDETLVACVEVGGRADAGGGDWFFHTSKEKHTNVDGTPRSRWTCGESTPGAHNQLDVWEVMSEDTPLMMRWVRHLSGAVLQRNTYTHERRVVFVCASHTQNSVYDVLVHVAATHTHNAFGSLSKSFCGGVAALAKQSASSWTSDEDRRRLWMLTLSSNGMYAHTDADSDALLVYLLLAVNANRTDLVHALYNQFLALCMPPWQDVLRGDGNEKQAQAAAKAWQFHVCRLLCEEPFGSPFAAYFTAKARIHYYMNDVAQQHNSYALRHAWYPLAYQLDQQVACIEEAMRLAPDPLVCRFDMMRRLVALPLVQAWTKQCRIRNDDTRNVAIATLPFNDQNQLEHLRAHFLQTRQDSLATLSKAWLAQRYERAFHPFVWLVRDRDTFYEILECDTVLALCTKLLDLQRQPTRMNAQECAEVHDILEQLSESDASMAMSRAPRDLHTILFETSFGMMIQHQQQVIVHDMYARLARVTTDTQPWMSTFQLLMGKGKTSVVTPLLVFASLIATRADKQMHHMIVLPAHLVRQSHTMFAARYANVLPWVQIQQPVVARELSAWQTNDTARACLHREWTRVLPYQHQRLSILSDDSLKALKLNCLEHNLGQELLTFFPRHSRMLLDEVDTLLNPLSNELNYPLASAGTERLLEHEVVDRLVVDLTCYAFMHKRMGPYASIRSASTQVYALARDFANAKGTSTRSYYAALVYYLTCVLPTAAAAEAAAAADVAPVKQASADVVIRPHDVYLVHRVLATLVHCTTQIHNKDYGFGTLDETRFVRKNGLVAVPYRAVQVPNDGSEFSDLVLSMMLTTLCYCQQTHLRKVDCDTFQGLVRADYQKHRNMRMLLGSSLFGSVLRTVETAGKLWKTLDDVVWPDVWHALALLPSTSIPRIAWVQALLRLRVFPTYMWLHRRQLNVSLLDVVCPSFCAARIGFSGTVSLPRLLLYPGKLPCHTVSAATRQCALAAKLDQDEWVVSDEISARYMRRAMLGDVHMAQVWEEEEEAEAVVTKNQNQKNQNENEDEDVKYRASSSIDALLRRVVAQEYDALIDAGAYLLQATAYEVAVHLHAAFCAAQHPRYVVYCDEQNVLRVVESDGASTRVYRNEWALSPQLFIYYDQPHIVGVDVKQPYSMRGLVTIAPFSAYTDTAQAAFRLRNLNRGHRFDYYCFRDSLRVWRDLCHMTAAAHTEIPRIIKTARDVVAFLDLNEQLSLDKMQRQMHVQVCKVLRRYHQTDADAYFTDATFNGRVTQLATAIDRTPLQALQTWTRQQLCVKGQKSDTYRMELEAICAHIQAEQAREPAPLYQVASQTRMQTAQQAQSTQVIATRATSAYNSSHKPLTPLTLCAYANPELHWPKELVLLGAGTQRIYMSPLVQRQISEAPDTWYVAGACYMRIQYDAYYYGKSDVWEQFILLASEEASALLLSSWTHFQHMRGGVYTQDRLCLRAFGRGEGATKQPFQPYARSLVTLVQVMLGHPLKLTDRFHLFVAAMAPQQPSDSYWQALAAYDVACGMPLLQTQLNGTQDAWTTFAKHAISLEYLRKRFLPATVDKFVGSLAARTWKRVFLISTDDDETTDAHIEETDRTLYDTLTCLFKEAEAEDQDDGEDNDT
jgi:hypothetical protein